MYSDYSVNTYKRVDVTFESGEGVWLTDTNGNKYLDFVAGIATNCLGHSHPAMVKAVKDQADRLFHISNLYWTKEQGELAKKLVELSDHEGVFFCNSGTEAVEGALKAARKYGKIVKDSKTKLISFNQSFHGRTMGALKVTGQEKYQKDFMPLIGDTIQCEFNNLEDVKSKMCEDVCAIIVEPIQGEGGIKPATQRFLRQLRELCDEYNALLIFDEVQCGAARLGTFFAYQSFYVVPDIVCMAKGLGGGVPIGAFIVNKRADVLTYGDHGCTFGGNPLVSAVSKTVVDLISDIAFLKDVKEKGYYLHSELINLMNKYPEIIEIRGLGLLQGIELSVPAKTVVEKAFEDGLLLVGAGENIVRIVPPLTVTYGELDIFLTKLDHILKSIGIKKAV